MEDGTQLQTVASMRKAHRPQSGREGHLAAKQISGCLIMEVTFARDFWAEKGGNPKSTYDSCPESSRKTT